MINIDIEVFVLYANQDLCAVDREIKFKFCVIFLPIFDSIER